VRPVSCSVAPGMVYRCWIFLLKSPFFGGFRGGGGGVFFGQRVNKSSAWHDPWKVFSIVGIRAIFSEQFDLYIKGK
jgi:hypothetical protein